MGLIKTLISIFAMTNSLLTYRYYYILIQAIVLGLLTMAVYLLDLKESITLFYFLIVWNILTYSCVLYNEITKYPGFHPFIIFALITLQYCGLSPIKMAELIESGETVYLAATPINKYLTLGYLFLSIEHYLIYCGYFLYDNKRLKCEDDHTNIFEQSSLIGIDLFKVAIYNYLFVLLLRLIDFFLPLASISSFIIGYAKNGFLVSLALLSYNMLFNNNTITKICYWTITIIEIIIVLNDGMKQAIITPLLPYIIYLLIIFKQKKNTRLPYKVIVKFSLIAIFVIGFVFPYIATFRELSNKKHKDWSEISVTETLNVYMDNLFSSSNTNKGQSGLDYFMSRAGSVGSNSFSVSYADKRGLSPEYFLYSISAIIPRIFWPDKPAILKGSTAYYMALGNSFEDSLAKAKKNKKSITSITLGFIGSSYLSFGFLGALIICTFAGYITARIWYFVKDKQCNIVAVWLFYSLLTTIFIDYENFVDCGLVFYITTLVYIIIIKLIDKYYFQWKTNEYSI